MKPDFPDVSERSSPSSGDMSCCIVIPVYKAVPEKTEIISLCQCLSVLSQYQIIITTYRELDCSAYNKIFEEYNLTVVYEYFSFRYFCSLWGYNALMLTKRFYKRFKSYKYMLVYQLDAYIFRDELEYWCRQDYDYIGAPWLSNTSITEPPVFGNTWTGAAVGNGGFSLRKIDTFIHLNSSEIKRMYVLSLCVSWFDMLAKKSRKNLFYKIARCVLFPFKILCDKINWAADVRKAEDSVWSKLIKIHGKMPSGEIAMRFSFEAYCDYLYELTNHELPFGCHGWPEYYRWKLFWRQFIQL